MTLLLLLVTLTSALMQPRSLDFAATMRVDYFHTGGPDGREIGTALIWITHDLAVVAGLADRVAVMYAGKIVEEGPVDAVLDAPLHPYTRGLIGSVPGRNRRGRPLAQIPGMAPSLSNLPPGCSFTPRCPRAQPPCAEAPPLVEALPGRKVRCFFPHREAAP